LWPDPGLSTALGSTWSPRKGSSSSAEQAHALSAMPRLATRARHTHVRLAVPCATPPRFIAPLLTVSGHTSPSSAPAPSPRPRRFSLRFPVPIPGTRWCQSSAPSQALLSAPITPPRSPVSTVWSVSESSPRMRTISCAKFEFPLWHAARRMPPYVPERRRLR
jgi:hypothetical protein